ncbi:MAG: 4-deoxy-4-formamido-L-arabinose-phosphoundecaprenol deformylase [Sedimentisphaerales bacterium]|nr:4-deoxy-4-formamido-L-arabinose-phosphoundecaprenol deformylase [Sedimentisphaerales bacterium]
MNVGLRIDVDTFRGTKLGVPNLCKIFADNSVKATFFFCVGPDNMGRHLWRLLRPAFFWKMMRTKAASLYGWDILFKGTFWPGPLIGQKLASVIRATANDGHEIGLHAYDHHQWQARLDTMTDEEIYIAVKKGADQLTKILGRHPVCSAVPAWKCNNAALTAKSKFDFKYNSDCRGQSIFSPVVNGQTLSQPQIPVTLPTYDEAIGKNGISDSNYNDYLLSLLNPSSLNVLTIHAEVEGIAKFDLFGDFLEKAQAKGVSFVPLGELLVDSSPRCRGAVVAKEIPGREGWLAYQEK